MWNCKRVAVVVPAFDEADRIARVIRGIPAWVDAVFVVDDASRDGTSAIANTLADSRVTVATHPENRGVGAAIVTGYRLALAVRADVIAVMAGDDQMDPHDLGRVVSPVTLDHADYVKGNRFMHPARRHMPFERRLAGSALALLTRAATGLDIDDSQCGFTALSAAMAARLPLEKLWPRYGYPNDLLGLLAAAGARVVEVPVRPVYAGERSGVRPWHALVVIGIVARGYLRARVARYD